MTYKEETYVLDTLKELKEKIRDMPIEQLIRETHENNIMLRQIIKVINTWFAHHHQENEDDFERNIMANLVSNIFDFLGKSVPTEEHLAKYVKDVIDDADAEEGYVFNRFYADCMFMNNPIDWEDMI